MPNNPKDKGLEFYPLQALDECRVVSVFEAKDKGVAIIDNGRKRVHFNLKGQCGFTNYRGDSLLNRHVRSTRPIPEFGETIFAVAQPAREGPDYFAIWWASETDLRKSRELSSILAGLKTKRYFVPEDFFSGHVTALRLDRGFGYINSDDTSFAGLSGIFFTFSHTAVILYYEGKLVSRWNTRREDVPHFDVGSRVSFLMEETAKGLKAYSVCPEETFTTAMKEYVRIHGRE